MSVRRLAVARRAQVEIEEAARWYESESAGLGRAFLQVLESVLDHVAESPRQFPIVHVDIRRALLKRFPYGVFFRIQPRSIRILAVLHLARHPGRWQSRR